MNIVIVPPHTMARISTPGRLDAVLRDSESTNSDDPPSGETTFLLRFVRKNRKTCQVRECPHSLALICCYVAIFFAGFQQHGVATVFTSVILNSFNTMVATGIAWTLLVGGAPYALLSLPIAYLLGQKVGYKWMVIVGQMLVYLYSLYNVLDCSLSHCLYKWRTEGVSIPAYSLIIFGLSMPVLTMNLWLLALEQIPHDSSETKSVCIHWMWLIFFLGRLTGSVIGSAIFWWTTPVFFFVIQLGMASTAMTIVIWAPLEKLIVGPYGLPFKTIWMVTKETLKQLRKGRNRQPQRRMDIPDTYDPDYEPNAFERASNDFSGPLPIGDVRDVQKFYLILFMLVSLVGIWIMYSLMTTVFVPEVSKLGLPDQLVDVSKSFSFWANEKNKTVSARHLSVPLTWMTNTCSDLTAVLTILILDRMVYPNFILWLNIRRRITIGVVFGFLACLAAVTTEAVRSVNQNYLGQSNATTVMNKIPSVFLSASIMFESAQVSVYWAIPQYLLYGVMVAFIMPGADELALIAAPAEMRAFLYGISHTLLGVSQIIAALFILSQNIPHTYWCFFCYSLPKTGLLTFVLTAVSMLLLFPVYLGLSRVYRKLELSIIKPRNPIILPRRVFN